MTGDTDDILSRLHSALPARWFPDNAPVLDAILTGLAGTWSFLYDMIQQLRRQSRIATATGATLDTIAQDFFAGRLPRRTAESDPAFRARIQLALRAEHATRAALAGALRSLTGTEPVIFEPSRATDTGAYNGPALGYGAAGAWGSLSLPFQAFVTVRRPAPPGIATVAGYGTGGPLARVNLAQTGAQISDADINAAIVSVLPAASIAWTRITN